MNAGLLAAGCWLLAALSGHAAELVFTACDSVARPGLPVRFQLERTSAAETTRGPWLVQVSLAQGDRILANLDLPLTRLTQLRNGITATLPVPEGRLESPLRLHAVLTSAARDLVEQTARILPTPACLVREAERAAGRALAGTADDLPRLWSEQAAELARLPSSLRTCDHLAALTRRLDGWADGQRTPDHVDGVVELACADAVDGSVQPCRLRLPATEAVAVVVLLADHPQAVIKADWPAIPAAWATAARAQRVAVVEVYPAGDRSWSGVGPRRAALALATARAAWPALRRTPALLMGAGRGAAGVVSLVENDPLAWLGFALVAPQLTLQLPPAPAGTDPAAIWLARHLPGQRPGNSAALPAFCAGTLPASLNAWRVARERDGGQLVTDLPPPDDAGFWRVLASAATAGPPQPTAPAAWTILVPGRYGTHRVPAMQTWGVAEILTARDAARPTPRSGKRLDRACGPLAAYAAGPFVVVVGTGEHAAAVEGNQRLAERFVADWCAHAHGRPPVVRDSAFRAADFPRHHLVLIGNPRSNRVCAELVDEETLPVRWDGRTVRAGGISLLRSACQPLALCWPHPADDGRLLVILDGAPAWDRDGLPLLGLPDLMLGPPERPFVSRLFDNDWR